jgi:acyl carrier protein
MSTIKTRIEKIVTEYTDTPVEEFSQAERFSDLTIDSLSVVEIVFDIEEAFDIQIPSEMDLENRGLSVKSFNDVLVVVNLLVEEKESNE